MALNANDVKMPKGNSVPQEPIEIGSHFARLVQVIDLGLHANTFDPAKAPSRKVNLTYELVTNFMKDADGNEDETKPRWVGEDMALCSLQADLAKSTKRIMALDPKGEYKGDLTKMIDTPCIVTIAHNLSKDKTKVYSNVSNVSPAPKGMPVPPLKNAPRVFDLDDPDLEVFQQLPSFIQDKIKANLEFRGSKLEALLNGTPTPPPHQETMPQEPNDEEVPF